MSLPVSQVKKVLGLIPARGGSKGLPRKNILLVGGNPLIAWTINAAKNSKSIDTLVLSSEDSEIIEVAKKWECEVPFRRPDHLAGDTAKSIDVVLHALDQMPGFEYVALLQPTSPLRNAEDIDAAFALMQECGAQSCVSVCESEESPYWMYHVVDGQKLLNLLPSEKDFVRRQDLPPVYILNGAIYIAKIDWLRQTGSFIGEGTVAYKMPKERSIDIDCADDLAIFRSKVEISHG